MKQRPAALAPAGEQPSDALLGAGIVARAPLRMIHRLLLVDDDQGVRHVPSKPLREDRGTDQRRRDVDQAARFAPLAAVRPSLIIRNGRVSSGPQPPCWPLPTGTGFRLRRPPSACRARHADWPRAAAPC
jgi:hypothetical protein